MRIIKNHLKSRIKRVYNVLQTFGVDHIIISNDILINLNSSQFVTYI